MLTSTHRYYRGTIGVLDGYSTGTQGVPAPHAASPSLEFCSAHVFSFRLRRRICWEEAIEIDGSPKRHATSLVLRCLFAALPWVLGTLGANACQGSRGPTDAECNQAVDVVLKALGRTPGRGVLRGSGSGVYRPLATRTRTHTACTYTHTIALPPDRGDEATTLESSWRNRCRCDKGWGEVPPGCSVMSGGDWAGHYNSGSGVSCGNTYTPICLGGPFSWLQLQHTTKHITCGTDKLPHGDPTFTPAPGGGQVGA